MSATSASRGRTLAPCRPSCSRSMTIPGRRMAARRLFRRFGQEFRIVCESSATAGPAWRELGVRGVPVALLIVGQELTGMSGVTFLWPRHQIHPQAVRILLVERDYRVEPDRPGDDTGPGRSHITKPWMLEATSTVWSASPWPTRPGIPRPPSTGSASWSASMTAQRTSWELLTRFNVPFRFGAADSGTGRHLLREHGLDSSAASVRSLRRALGGQAGPRAPSPQSAGPSAMTSAVPRRRHRRGPTAAWRPRSATPHRRACKRWSWKRPFPAADQGTATSGPAMTWCRWRPGAAMAWP